MSAAASIAAIDSQFVKVPYEALKREASKRRALIEGLQAVTSRIAAARSRSDLDRTDAHKLLRELLEHLQEQIRKNQGISAAEEGNLRRCAARAAHLASVRPLAGTSVVDWNERRLPRLLADCLLRQGRFDTARILARDQEDLCDYHVFGDAQAIMQQLLAKDCNAALEWHAAGAPDDVEVAIAGCAAHASRLRKVKSRLLFRLHVQQYVELIKRGDTGAALRYAREHLSQFAAADFAELKRAMALLVYGKDTTCPRYSPLLDDARWTDLGALFLQALLSINNLTAVSLLELQLQAGLTALKCPLSYEDGCTKEDPLHLPEMRRLAEGLPWAKHVSSKLVCSVTLRLMDDSNPPWVLPNGYVYSLRALDVLACDNGARVRCAVTGDTFMRDDCIPAYIV